MKCSTRFFRNTAIWSFQTKNIYVTFSIHPSHCPSFSSFFCVASLKHIKTLQIFIWTHMGQRTGPHKKGRMADDKWHQSNKVKNKISLCHLLLFSSSLPMNSRMLLLELPPSLMALLAFSFQLVVVWRYSILLPPSITSLTHLSTFFFLTTPPGAGPGYEVWVFKILKAKVF